MSSLTIVWSLSNSLERGIFLTALYFSHRLLDQNALFNKITYRFLSKQFRSRLHRSNRDKSSWLSCYFPVFLLKHSAKLHLYFSDVTSLFQRSYIFISASISILSQVSIYLNKSCSDMKNLHNTFERMSVTKIKWTSVLDLWCFNTSISDQESIFTSVTKDGILINFNNLKPSIFTHFPQRNFIKQIRSKMN